MVRDSSIGLNTSRIARTKQWLRGVARQMTHDSALADDLVQTTFCAALTPERPVPVRAMRPWLHGVIRNVYRMWCRTGARAAAREADVADALHAGTAAAGDNAWQLTQVRRALADLGEPYRSVLRMRFIEDLTPAEITERWGLPPSTLRRQTAQGLALLQARFGANEPAVLRRWRASDHG